MKNKVPLDISFFRQFLATFAASLGSFAWGQSIGWSSVVNPHLRKVESGLGIDDDGSSWVGSSLSIGGFVGGLMGGTLMNVLGRKRSLILVTLISLGGWILLATSNNLISICIGRFICGWVAACDGLISPVYIGEISSSKYRGAFGSFLCLSLAFGITSVFIIGAFVPSWQLITVACLVPVVIGFFVLLIVPESPYFLISKYNDEKAARKSLDWFYCGNIESVDRCIQDIRDYQKSLQIEADPVVDQNEKVEKSEKEKIADKGDEVLPMKLTKSGCCKPVDNISLRMMFMLCMIMVFSRLTGISPLSYYLVEIFQKSSLAFDAVWSAVIVSVMEIVGMGLSLVLTDRAGRRILLIISGLGVSICLSVLAWSFKILLTTQEDQITPIMRYVPLITMLVFYLVFSVGYGPIPIVLLSEVFPTHTKALATSVSISVLWLFDFAVAKLYFVASNHLGVDGNFYLLSGLSFLGVIFIFVFVPETKNKTLAEIQDLVKYKKTFLTCSECRKSNSEA